MPVSKTLLQQNPLVLSVGASLHMLSYVITIKW